MKSRTVIEHRDLQVQEAMVEDQGISSAPLRLDIAVGLANLDVRRLIQKGLVKCVNAAVKTWTGVGGQGA